MCGQGAGVGVGGPKITKPSGILVCQCDTIPAEGSPGLVPPRCRGGSDIDL